MSTSSLNSGSRPQSHLSDGSESSRNNMASIEVSADFIVRGLPSAEAMPIYQQRRACSPDRNEQSSSSSTKRKKKHRSTSLASLTEHDPDVGHFDLVQNRVSAGASPRRISGGGREPGRSSISTSSLTSGSRPQSHLSDGSESSRGNMVCGIEASADLIVQRGLPSAEAMLSHRQMRACSPDRSEQASASSTKRKVKQVQNTEAMVWEAISRLSLERAPSGD